MKSLHLELADADVARALAGAHNENFKIIERRLGVKVGHRGIDLHVSGPDAAVGTTAQLLEQLTSRLETGQTVFTEDVEHAIKVLGRHGHEALKAMQAAPILTQRGRSIVPRGPAQAEYLERIRSHDLVFGVGPAGTGKTYLAMAMAVSALQERRVRKIVLARPAVEAGEKLGFLPGDMAEKVNPYLRPLYDALGDMMEPERVTALTEQGVIEVAPLAFMRGRTLNECFAILDEAQNTTVEQMKMFLTRLGHHSKAVVTGDVTQIDLPRGQRSGLVHAHDILRDVEGIAFAQFTEVDVVRHPVVQEVIKAYARDEAASSDDNERAAKLKAPEPPEEPVNWAAVTR